MDRNEIESIIENADVYLFNHGKDKKLNWFDMSHLLSYLLPLEKEEILEIHIQQCQAKMGV